jgi:hypothetical protein
MSLEKTGKGLDTYTNQEIWTVKVKMMNYDCLCRERIFGDSTIFDPTDHDFLQCPNMDILFLILDGYDEYQ